jgi:hypothetical protein
VIKLTSLNTVVYMIAINQSICNSINKPIKAVMFRVQLRSCPGTSQRNSKGPRLHVACREGSRHS